MKYSIRTYPSFVGILRHHAESRPDFDAFVFLQANGNSRSVLSYRSLHERAKEVGAFLQSAGGAGQRVLLFYPSGPDFVTAFFGCLYAGAIGVPSTDSNRLKRTATRLASIIADARPGIGLTNSSMIPILDRLARSYPEIKTVNWVSTDKLPVAAGPGWVPPPIHSDSLAVLQYTSGSTSSPKGVMLTHGNLLRNQEVMHETMNQTDESVFVGWLPHYHDMGLIGLILHPIYLGARCVLMSPVHFLQRPFRWLEAITQYRATATGAPNFAFDLCVERITAEEKKSLDLSSLEVVFNGSEPIRPQTLERFSEAFSPCGFREETFYPCYGIAEATLLVSAPNEARPTSVIWVDPAHLEKNRVVQVGAGLHMAHPLVGCGSALAGLQIAIVNPQTLERCAANTVGEVWISGASVGLGYWNNAEVTRRNFRAFIADSGEGPFLRTGDLGFLLNGELFITGRLRDIIIIRGMNIYPQDIEFTVEQNLSYIRKNCSAAFSINAENEERLVVAVEVAGNAKVEPADVVTSIRREISLNHGLDLYAVAILKPNTIPKTSSGKIQRHACRNAYLKGALGDVYVSELAAKNVALSSEDINAATVMNLPKQERKDYLQSCVVSLVSSAAKIPADAVQVHRPILEYGLDSLKLLMLKHELEESFRFAPPISAFFKGMTIRRLVSAILREIENPSAARRRHRPDGRSVSSVHPTSQGQRALWFFFQQNPADAAYNIGGAVRIRAELNIEALNQAVQELVDRHKSLRTSFESSPAGPAQRVREHCSVDLELYDIQGWSKEKLSDHLSKEFHRPFDLTSTPPLRIQLYSLSQQEHVLLLALHHIIADLWSVAIMARELTEMYGAALEGRIPRLAPLPLEYTDYIQWHESVLRGPEGRSLYEYWEKNLQGDLPSLNLPTDRPRPLVMSNRGARQTIILDETLAEDLRELALANSTTLFVVLLAAFKVLLRRYTHQEEIRVGTPSTGRTQSNFDSIVGYFANTVVLRSRISGEMEFQTFLRQLCDTVSGALDHSSYPFSLLVQQLQPARDYGVIPLIQTLFVWQSLPPDSIQDFPALAFDVTGLELQWDGWPVESIGFEAITSQFDLMLSMAEYGKKLLCSIQYSTDLFDRVTVERMLGHFRMTLRAITQDSFTRVSQFSMLTSEELSQFDEWNQTAIEYDHTQLLHRLFEAQVERNPHWPAVYFEKESITYEELNYRANHVAHHLLSLGVGPETPVAVMLEPGFDMVIAILGILKAGGAYVPINPDDPAARVAIVLEDTNPVALITMSGWGDKAAPERVKLVCLDSDWQVISSRSGRNVSSHMDPDSLAYIIYTSGSTGRPKGVMISHRAISNRLLWMRDEYQLSESDIVLHKTPYTFDVSVWEVFLPLITGTRMVVTKPGGHRDPTYLVDLIIEREITVLHFVPTMLTQVLEEPRIKEAASLRRVICSGEALPAHLQERFFERVRAELHNLYGPTEASVDVTYWVCQRDSSTGVVPIGRPIANTQIYILDQHMNRVPVGVTGELHIGGAGLARGYYGRPDLTAELFLPNSFGNSTRLYRTGDNVRFRSDGAIEFLGRMDHQIKVRGVRVEIAEVEAALASCPGIIESAVIFSDKDKTGPRLIAYIVPAEGDPPAVADLRQSLRKKLPEAFIPSSFQFLKALPLTSSGKIDRKMLAASSQQPTVPDANFVGPATKEEFLLAFIWQEVLGVDRVSVFDNFFVLGGDSLRVPMVVARARQSGYDLTIQQLFEFPTIRQLASLIRKADLKQRAEIKIEPFSLISERSREALAGEIQDAFPLSKLQEGLVFYSQYSAAYEIYIMSLHVRAPLKVEAMKEALSALAARHEMLRVSYNLTDFEESLQLVHPAAAIPLEINELGHKSYDEQEREIDEWILRERNNQFDWAKAPLMRIRADRRTDSTFQITFSHPFFDGWSMASLITELFTDYMFRVAGKQPPRISAPSISFRDFIAVEQLAIQSAAIRNFWRAKLADCSASILPLQPRPLQPGNPERHRVRVNLPVETVAGLKRLASAVQVPLKSVLLAAHLRVVSFITGQDDVITGLITNGRLDEPDGDRVIGTFLNTLPLRMKMAGGSWEELVRRTFQAEQELWAYRHFPLAEIRSMQGGVPFDTAFNFINFHIYNQLRGLNGFEVLGWKNPSDQTYFHLCAYFNIDPISDGLMFFLDFDTHFLEDSKIHDISSYYISAFELMANHSGESIDRKSLLSEQELQRQLKVWNDTRIDYPDGALRPVHQLFEARAALHPENVAAAFSAGTITYSQLNEKSNRLARHLRSLGVGPGVIVGVFTDRTQEMLVAILGILKAGGAYLPLDAAYPANRLISIVEESRAAVVITGTGRRELFPVRNIATVRLDFDESLIAKYSAGNLDHAASKDSLAYVIYTSGSGGAPKGVEIEHVSLTNLLYAVGALIGIDEREVFLSVTTLSFDISAVELFLPLITGAQVAVADENQAHDGSQLGALLESSGATIMQATPSTWRLLLEDNWKGSPELRMLCGGEPLTRDLANQLLKKGAALWNLYGPTETTIWSSACEVRPGDSTLTIGRPLANTTMYVLDSDMNPLPVGVPGELCIGGTGLARGYRIRPDLTAERFVADPFSNNPGGRLYKTGDQVRLREDGEIDFLGRLDNQVKVRGFRIELGEIEVLLSGHEDVREAVVVVREFAVDDQRLIAYVTLKPGRNFVDGSLKNYLATLVPSYMIPAAFIALDSLPSTPSGKVDRRALPKPAPSAPRKRGDYSDLTETQRIIIDLWQQVLQVNEVGVNDNFFDLGGHSLLLLRVYNRLQARMRRSISLLHLFQYPTVSLLADYLDRPNVTEQLLENSINRAQLRKKSVANRRELIERRPNIRGTE